MSRPVAGPTRRRKRAGTTRKQRDKTRPESGARKLGPDAKDVKNPRGGYQHKGETPSALGDLEAIDLRGTWAPGEMPDAVMQGRRLMVLGLMLQGEITDNVIRFCSDNYLMSATQTRYIMADIRARWRADIDEAIGTARAETIMRLRRDLSQMRTDPKARTAKDWGAILRHETLLSRIEGTQQPVKVVVHDMSEVMREAAVGILGTMDEEEMNVIVTQGEELVRAANRLLPAAAE